MSVVNPYAVWAGGAIVGCTLGMGLYSGLSGKLEARVAGRWAVGAVIFLAVVVWAAGTWFL